MRRREADAVERERDGWRELVRRYIAEVENPAPDYTMRRILRDWMKDSLDDPSKLPEPRRNHR